MNGESTFKKLFPVKHIPTILLALLEAGSTLRKKSNNEREDPITLRLCRELKKILVFRDGPLSIWHQVEILSDDPGKDTPGGRIDLLVPSDLGSEVYFAIEAKRLRVSSPDGRIGFAGTSQYIAEGMMRFVKGKYAPGMQAGAMLGYVFDGNLDAARSNIDRSIRNRARTLRLLPPKRLAESDILAGKQVDETGHDLIGRIFIIYHVFLPV